MAYTYTISDALNVANRSSMSRGVEDDNAPFIANAAIDHIWKRYDWRETLAALPPFWLISSTQDYGAPFYAVPQDFYGIKLAYLVQTTSTPVTRWELKPIKNPRLDYVPGLPKNIGYVPETRSLRIYPIPPANLAPTQFLIDGTYKMRPPLVTSTTLQSTLVPWDDMYILEFVAALRWASMKVSGNPGAANALQELDYLLDQMANAEGMELGDQPVSPTESIFGQGNVGGYGAIGLGIF